MLAIVAILGIVAILAGAFLLYVGIIKKDFEAEDTKGGLFLLLVGGTLVVMAVNNFGTN